MQMSPLSCRPMALRSALKRGRAREAFSHAAREEATSGDVLAEVRGLRPNRKGLERVAARLRRRPGVVRVALLRGGGIVLVLRGLREVRQAVGAEALFDEAAVVYSRVTVMPERRQLRFGLVRAGFCQHAVERLVERSAVPVDRPLLPILDQEAVALFAALLAGKGFDDRGDGFVPALQPGVWAGGWDQSAMEEDWGPVAMDGRVPFFSIRTFLGAAEMRPTVWARWSGAVGLVAR